MHQLCGHGFLDVADVSSTFIAEKGRDQVLLGRGLHHGQWREWLPSMTLCLQAMCNKGFTIENLVVK